MAKFVPYEKASKRRKKELNTMHRKTWGALNPVTRKPVNPKAYNRSRSKDDSNYLTSCKECFDEDWAYYEERWEEFYHSR